MKFKLSKVNLDKMSVGINLSVEKRIHNMVEPRGIGRRMFPPLEILNLYH